MRSTLALAISLTAALASAHLDQRIPGYELALLGRDLGGNCTRSSTCDECFGDGNVVCDNAGCFNPHAAEQCCKNGNICVAKDNSCCDSLGGSGVTGTSGAVPTATATSTASLPESSAWTCKRFQSNEDCCQGGGPDMHWCSGDYPNTVCYNSTLQICCSQGTVCEGKGCCDLVSASAVTPWTSLAAHTSSASSATATATASATSTGAARRAMVTPFARGLAGIGAAGIGLVL